MSKLAKALTASAGNAGGTEGYVEDVFSTFIYDGNNTSNAIVNGLDLAGEGGLLWTKRRDGTKDNRLWDTERGRAVALSSNSTNQQGSTSTASEDLLSFNSNGFTFGANAHYGQNSTSQNYVSWSFRKAKKFFDVVTWTGNATAGRQIPHSLDSTPGFIITKRTDAADNWKCYHVGNPSPAEDYVIELDSNSTASNEGIWNDTAPTATNFTVSAGGAINASGGTYVAYLFALDAGGFGDSGSESIIKCGSYEGNGVEPAGPIINLGFEPQWILIKDVDTGTNWTIFDNMRGMPVGGADARLFPNLTNAENNFQVLDILPTGFQLRTSSGGYNENNKTHIYVAIRRGPMKIPTAGTEVFTAVRPSSSGTFTAISGFPTDFTMNKGTGSGDANYTGSRLQGVNSMQPQTTAAESSVGFSYDFMDRITIAGSGNYSSWISWNFKRGTGFMDVVAGKSDASGNVWNGTHNLGVNIEFAIVKNRQSSSTQWWTADLNAGKLLKLNQNDSGASLGTDFTTTTTTFKAFDGYLENNENFVLYAFATLAGVSKVGTYTGNAGYAVNVPCGFSNSARFILIKRTDSTGDWYVWDNVRGITAGNDPYLLLNSTAAEVTNTDYIDPLSSGFTVTSSAPAGLNASSGTYIFLAIA